MRADSGLIFCSWCSAAYLLMMVWKVLPTSTSPGWLNCLKKKNHKNFDHHNNFELIQYECMSYFLCLCQCLGNIVSTWGWGCWALGIVRRQKEPGKNQMNWKKGEKGKKNKKIPEPWLCPGRDLRHQLVFLRKMIIMMIIIIIMER